MVRRAKAKQIALVLAANIQIANFSSTASNSAVITPTLTTAVSTAGRNNQQVPLQPSTNEDTVGVVTAGASNLVQIIDNATKEPIDASGENEEVYGRISFSTSTYTISYFYLDNGVETAYTFASDTAIDLTVTYRFQFEKLPGDAIVSYRATNINQDPNTIGTKIEFELLNVTATNTLSDLTQAIADPLKLKLIINGITYHSGAGNAVGLSGSTPTWNPGAFLPDEAFDITTDDEVYAWYPVV